MQKELFFGTFHKTSTSFSTNRNKNSEKYKKCANFIEMSKRQKNKEMIKQNATVYKNRFE